MNKNTDFEEMVKNIPFLEYAAQQENPAAMFWLAWNYLYGRNGVVRDDGKAYALLLKSAEIGYADAQYLLAMWYLTGNDGAVPPNYTEAVRYFQSASAQGHVESMYQLSRCYLKGLGVTVDTEESIKWLTKAADGGLAEAQCKLGEAYANGEGVNQDINLSFKYLSLATKQGYAEAEYCLGILYRDGSGIVPKDPMLARKYFEVAGAHGYHEGFVELYRMMSKDNLTEATQYLRRAAEAGHTEAQLQLARQYELGLGLPRLVAKARIWYKRAAANGNKEAVDSLKRLE